MKKFLLIILLAMSPALALAEEPLPANKITIGENVIDFKTQAGSTAKSAAYFFAVLLAGLGLWKKFRGKNKDNVGENITVTARTNLSPRAALLVADVGGERFLIGQTDERISLISRLSSPFDDDEDLDTEDEILDSRISNA